jgi:hypothetical protein
MIVTSLALAGLLADKLLFHTPPVDAAGYHERVRGAAATVPLHIGSWLGVDTPVPTAAVEMLNPNVVISRRYEDLRTHQSISFLLVQVSDVRDILGHYPPYCYPARGSPEMSREAKTWDLGGLKINGTTYSFASHRLATRAETIVDHVVILPNVNTYSDMNEATNAAQHHRRKFFGAAHIQLVYDDSVSSSEREEIFKSFFAANRTLIDQIRTGAIDE